MLTFNNSIDLMLVKRIFLLKSLTNFHSSSPEATGQYEWWAEGIPTPQPKVYETFALPLSYPPSPYHIDNIASS